MSKKEPNFDIHELIAWLETKNPTGEYDYNSPTKCLLAQFFKHQGVKDPLVGPRDVDWGNWGVGESKDLPKAFWEISKGNLSQVDNHTFGAALERARKYA
jgi:hypothetical protein